MQELFPGAWRGLWIEKNTFGGLMAFAFVTVVRIRPCSISAPEIEPRHQRAAQLSRCLCPTTP